MKKLLSATLVLIIMTCMITGCKKEEKSEGKDDIYIGFSIVTLEYPYYVSMQEGIEETCKKEGYKYVTADAGPDVATQIDDCLDMIVKGVDALIVSSWYGDSLSEVFEEAKASGIPVFLIDTSGVPEEEEFVTNIGTDNKEAGYCGGLWTAEYFKEQENKEKINCLTFLNSTSISRDRIDGFIKGLEEGGLEVNLLNEYLGESREDYMSSAEDALVTYPEIDLICGSSAQAGLGAYDATVGAGRKEIKILSFDSEKDEMDLIDKKTNYIASVMQKPYEMGEKAVVSAYEFMKKDAKFDRATANEFGVYCIDGELSSEDIMK